MLMTNCPVCGAVGSIRRNTQEFGTPQEWSFIYCTKCHFNRDESSPRRSVMDDPVGLLAAGKWTRERLAEKWPAWNDTTEDPTATEGADPSLKELEHSADLMNYAMFTEALKMIAGVPDFFGLTYGSALHDVGKIVAFARRVLDGHAPHDVVGTLR